jgi:hypothetical protein
MTEAERRRYTQLIMDVAQALTDFFGGEVTFERVYQAAQALRDFVPQEFQGDPRDYVYLVDPNDPALLTPAERRQQFKVIDRDDPV